MNILRLLFQDTVLGTPELLTDPATLDLAGAAKRRAPQLRVLPSPAVEKIKPSPIQSLVVDRGAVWETRAFVLLLASAWAGVLLAFLAAFAN